MIDACVLFRQQGMVTPTVYLFKGKRSTIAPSEEQAEVRAAGEVYFGDSEAFEGDEAPGWMAKGMRSSELDEPDLDFPSEDVGQKKPFKF